jgi:dienelactone hydrolase
VSGRHRRAAIFFAAAPVLVLAAFAVPHAMRLWRAEVLLDSLAAAASERATGNGDGAVEAEALEIASSVGPIRARLYCARPCGRGAGIVAVHGVHRQGIDERRLVAFARALARAGAWVLTPELDELADYRITAKSERQIGESVRFLAGRSDLVADDRVGLLGFSFAGGLSLRAAEEPDVGAKLAWVASVGGHHDLARVLRFLLHGREEARSGIVLRAAHEYGLVILIYSSLDDLVPASDRDLMRDALRSWLGEDRVAARALAARRTSREAERLFELLESGRLAELGPVLENALERHAGDLAALSPRGRLAAIPCPVYLLHGRGDNVVPPSETEWADVELGARPHAALVSPLIEHVELDKPAGLGDKLALLDFVAALL